MAAAKLERFRAADVCQLADVQPYELRSWEAEFADLGHTPPGGGARIYTRADVERVLQIRELVKGEGLTLAGARRRLEESASEAPPPGDFTLVDATTRARLRSVRERLVGLLTLLERPVAPADFTLVAATASASRSGSAKSSRRGK
jgi:DNA-binding transcriptional MerR regulator